ncbi:MAG: glycosyltransferase [Streptosporangiaceae bacterium]
MTAVQEVPASAGAIWVGLLDLDACGPAVSISGPLRGHDQARLLVRWHGAPLGYVTVPAQPRESLAGRAASAARAALAGPLRQHEAWDREAAAGPAGWTARIACPQRQPDTGPGVSIVVCSRNRAAGLRECVRTLQQARYEPLEILVVDNAPSDDQTRQAVAELAAADPRVHYTCEPAPGLSRARNHGLARARHEIIAFTDDDVLADPGWPAAVAAGFAADPQTVCVTGLVPSGSLDTRAERYFDSRYSWGDSFRPRQYDLRAHRDDSRLYPFSAGVFGTGANFAVRRPAVAEVGEFDPLLGAGSPGRGGEDLDMFVRLILSGGRLAYLPGALVWHRHRAETGALSEQIYAYGFGLGAYLAKHLMDRTLPVSLLAYGAAKSASVLARMRQASQRSELAGEGSRMAVREVSAILAGALRYWRARREDRHAGR